MVIEPSHGITKRFTASLIDDDDLGGYLVVTNMVLAEGRNLSLVDARRLEEGGHVHIQVCVLGSLVILGAAHAEWGLILSMREHKEGLEKLA